MNDHRKPVKLSPEAYELARQAAFARHIPIGRFIAEAIVQVLSDPEAGKGEPNPRPLPLPPDPPPPARPRSRPKRQPTAPPPSTDDPSPAADPAPPPAPSPPPNIRFCLRCPRPTDPAHEWGRCDCPCHDPDAINDDARQKGQAEKRAAAEAL